VKKLFLISIAALFLATGAAQAWAGEPPPAEAALPLADPVIGHWCPVRTGVYQRGAWDCKGNLLVKPDEYFNDDNDCIFSDIKRLSSRDGYVIRAKCMGDVHQKVELRIVDGTLHYRVVPTTCGKVGDGMSDGFLNLRSGPGMRYAVMAKLVTNDTLEIGETINGWTHISIRYPGRNDKNKEVNGWVSSRYVVRRCYGDET
jgi:Bacterial SH3 domain